MTSAQIVGLGFLLTGVFIVFCVGLGMMEHCITINGVNDCRTNFGRFIQSPPNEKGDTLAGVAGSLAFLWIIITVLLQGKELSQQRDEIEKMRITQEEQTGLLVKQSTLMDQSRIDDQIGALVDHLRTILPELGFREWQIGTTQKDVAATVFIGQNWDIPKDQTVYSWWIDVIETTTETVLSKTSGEKRVLSPQLPTSWVSVEAISKEIIELREKASPKQQTWLDKTVRIQDLQAVLSNCITKEELWAS